METSWHRQGRLTAALAIVLSLAACDQESSTPAAAPPTPEVGVVTIRPQAVAVTRELEGRTTAYLVAEVRPQVSGIIEKREFDEGSNVEAGDVLYRIASATYQANLQRAEAALARADANLAAARSTAARFRQLAKVNAASRQAAEDAVAAEKLAQADVAASKAEVSAARTNLGFAQVTAPISGRIGRSTVTQGALVTAGQADPLATIQQIEPIYVDVTQSANQLLQLKDDYDSGKFKIGGDGRPTLRLRLDGDRFYEHEGTLELAEAIVDPTTGTITLRGSFPNPQRRLLPGMYVRAVLQAGIDEHALVVPQQGISRDPKGSATALIVGPDNKVEQRTLTTGRATQTGWLVTSGLKDGERVIVAGVQKVRPGVEVKAVEAEVAPAPAGRAVEATTTQLVAPGSSAPAGN